MRQVSAAALQLSNDRRQPGEVIACKSSKLKLSSTDILALSSTTDTLKVLGNENSSVNIVGAFVDEGVHDGFHRYKVGAAILLVDTDITDVG